MTIHNRILHATAIGTQTEEKEFDDKVVQTLAADFSCDKTMQTIQDEKPRSEKYPCYYCGINIVSESHLNEHKRKCRGTSRICGVLGLPSGNSSGLFQLPNQFSTGFVRPSLFY